MVGEVLKDTGVYNEVRTLRIMEGLERWYWVPMFEEDLIDIDTGYMLVCPLWPEGNA
jgi:hypothetical protein